MSTVNPLEGIDLHAGDLGLVFIEGIGFRPKDGVDSFSAKFDCPVVTFWKDMKYDKVVVERRCEEVEPIFSDQPVVFASSEAAPPAIYYNVPQRPFWSPDKHTETFYYVSVPRDVDPIPEPPKVPDVDLSTSLLYLVTALGLTLLAKWICPKG